MKAHLKYEYVERGRVRITTLRGRMGDYYSGGSINDEGCCKVKRRRGVEITHEGSSTGVARGTPLLPHSIAQERATRLTCAERTHIPPSTSTSTPYLEGTGGGCTQTSRGFHYPRSFQAGFFIPSFSRRRKQGNF